MKHQPTTVETITVTWIETSDPQTIPASTQSSGKSRSWGVGHKVTLLCRQCVRCGRDWERIAGLKGASTGSERGQSIGGAMGTAEQSIDGPIGPPEAGGSALTPPSEP